MKLKIKKGVLIDKELGMIGHITNKKAVDELVKRVNEYETLHEKLIKNGSITIENLSAKCANLEIENQQIKTLIRELAEKLEIVVATYEMGYMLNDVMIEDIKDTLEKYEYKEYYQKTKGVE